jgi:hypothetical protein
MALYGARKEAGIKEKSGHSSRLEQNSSRAFWRLRTGRNSDSKRRKCDPWPGTSPTVWSKSHATHIKLVIDCCNSIKFDWINRHNIAVTIQEPTQVTSCCNLLAQVRHLSSSSRSARMSFSQVQRVFIVEHYLASRSYLTCQNEFRDTFPDSPVPSKSTISRLVDRFPSVQKLFTELHQTRGKEWMHASLNAVNISNTSFDFFFLFPDFKVIYFLTNFTCARNGFARFSIILYINYRLSNTLILALKIEKVCSFE